MTDELRLPCQESETPDDWFISRDGKQYTDEELLTDEDRYMAWSSIENAERRELTTEEKDRAIDRAEAEVKRINLQRRRHAREACHDCLFRTRCLDRALREGIEHGTWGGYFEEQIREIRREISRRRRGRELRLIDD